MSKRESSADPHPLFLIAIENNVKQPLSRLLAHPIESRQTRERKGNEVVPLRDTITSTSASAGIRLDWLFPKYRSPPKNRGKQLHSLN